MFCESSQSTRLVHINSRLLLLCFPFLQKFCSVCLQNQFSTFRSVDFENGFYVWFRTEHLSKYQIERREEIKYISRLMESSRRQNLVLRTELNGRRNGKSNWISHYNFYQFKLVLRTLAPSSSNIRESWLRIPVGREWRAMGFRKNGERTNVRGVKKEGHHHFENLSLPVSLSIKF